MSDENKMIIVTTPTVPEKKITRTLGPVSYTHLTLPTNREV